MAGFREHWKIRHVKETVLLVDAEDGTRQAVKMVLKLNGYRVVEALTGIEGLQVLGEWGEDIHLAVCADELPDMTAGQWRGQVHFLGPKIPSLILSERDRDEIANLDIGNQCAGKANTPSTIFLPCIGPQAAVRLLEKIRLALDERFFTTRMRATAA